MADLDEAGGQHVEHETADELDRIEGHDAAAVAMSGVSPSEAHLAVIETEESSIADCNSMGVAGQILQHMFELSRRLGVDQTSTSAISATLFARIAIEGLLERIFLEDRSGNQLWINTDAMRLLGIYVFQFPLPPGSRILLFLFFAA